MNDIVNKFFFNKKLRKYVRARDDKYDYYVNITELNKKSFWKGFYKYKNKTCAVYIFNKSADPLKSNNIGEGFGVSMGLLLPLITKNINLQISILSLALICLVLTLIVIWGNHFLYLYTIKEI